MKAQLSSTLDSYFSPLLVICKMNLSRKKFQRFGKYQPRLARIWTCTLVLHLSPLSPLRILNICTLLAPGLTHYTCLSILRNDAPTLPLTTPITWTIFPHPSIGRELIGYSRRIVVASRWWIRCHEQLRSGNRSL